MVALWCGVAHLSYHSDRQGQELVNMKLLYHCTLPEEMLRNLPRLLQEGTLLRPWFLMNGIYVGGLCILRMIIL